jgi:hypothetical protein
MVSGVRVAHFHKDKITRILKMIQEKFTKKGVGSGIRKKINPDPDPGGKKEPEPGSATLHETGNLYFQNLSFEHEMET